MNEMIKSRYILILGNTGRIAFLISLCIVIITFTLWLITSSVSEIYVNSLSIFLTIVLSIASLITCIIKWEQFRWPLIWASVGALIGTRLTIVTFSIILGGYNTVFGFVDLGSKQSFPGSVYTIVGACIGIILFALTQYAKSALKSWKH